MQSYRPVILARMIHNYNAHMEAKDGLKAYEQAAQLRSIAANEPRGYLMGANACVLLRRYDEAKRLYHQALEKNKTVSKSKDFTITVNAHKGLAEIYLVEEKWQEVIDHANESLRTMSFGESAIVCRSLRALAYVKQKRYQLAIDEATDIIEQYTGFTQYSECYFTRAVAYFALGKLQDAREDALAYREINPNNEFDNSFKDFMANLDSMIPANSNYSCDENIKRAKQYLKDKKFNNAIIETCRVLKHFPNHVEARVILANAYLAKSKYNEALANAEAALINIDDKNAYAIHLVLAEIKEKMNNDADALVELNHIAMPTIETLALQAIILIKQNKVAEALVISNEMEKLQPKHVAIYRVRMAAAKKNNDYPNLGYHAKAILSLDPYDKLAAKELKEAESNGYYPLSYLAKPKSPWLKTLSRIFNPFEVVRYDSVFSPDARSLHTNFSCKVSDTFHVFDGGTSVFDKNINEFILFKLTTRPGLTAFLSGIFILPLIHILFSASLSLYRVDANQYKNVFWLGLKLAKTINFFILIPLGIAHIAANGIYRHLASAVLTLASLPFIYTANKITDAIKAFLSWKFTRSVNVEINNPQAQTSSNVIMLNTFMKGTSLQALSFDLDPVKDEIKTGHTPSGSVFTLEKPIKYASSEMQTLLRLSPSVREKALNASQNRPRH